MTSSNGTGQMRDFSRSQADPQILLLEALFSVASSDVCKRQASAEPGSENLGLGLPSSVGSKF